MITRTYLLLAGLIMVTQLTGLRADQVRYLQGGRPDPIALLAPPPLPGSEEQMTDLAAVVRVEQHTSAADRAVAYSEKKFDVFVFAAAVGEDFKPGRYPQLEAFFRRLEKTTDEITNRAKDYWQRDRPYVVEPALAKGELEKSFSYPSGHSTRGMVFALALADLFPSQRDAILAEGRTLGWHRVQIARHYPTDVYAGRILAQAIFRELQGSSAFQADFEQVRHEVHAAELMPVL